MTSYGSSQQHQETFQIEIENGDNRSRMVKISCANKLAVLEIRSFPKSLLLDFIRLKESLSGKFVRVEPNILQESPIVLNYSVFCDWDAILNELKITKESIDQFQLIVMDIHGNILKHSCWFFFKLK